MRLAGYLCAILAYKRKKHIVEQYSRRSFLALGAALVPAVALATGPKLAVSEAPRKKVLLIGDYMKKYYEEQVRDLLKERAEVVWPTENCGNTIDVIRNMEGWVKKFDPDVIYIAAGFEDIRTVYYGSFDNMVPLKFYKRNVRNILEGVFMFSNRAIPIWACMTPINDEKQGEAKSKTKDYSIFNDDVIDYNAAAQKVAKQYKVSVVDLYSAIAYNNPDLYLNETGFLLNSKGAATTAKTIAQHIENYL